MMAAAVFLLSCGSTKGYKGTKLNSSELARIYQGDHKLKVKGKTTIESALLVKIDTLTIGSYMKGFPKHIDVLPGEKCVEIRHFRQWKDNMVTNGISIGLASAFGGIVGGVIVASALESNNPHLHYKLIFPVEKGKTYTIMPSSDIETLEPNFYIIEKASSDTIRPKIIPVKKIKNRISITSHVLTC